MSKLIQKRKQTNKQIEKLVVDFTKIMEENNMPFVLGYITYEGVGTQFYGDVFSTNGMVNQLKEEIESDDYNVYEYDN